MPPQVFGQDFYQTYTRITGNQGLAQILFGALLSLKHRKISRKPLSREWGNPKQHMKRQQPRNYDFWMFQFNRLSGRTKRVSTKGVSMIRALSGNFPWKLLYKMPQNRGNLAFSWISLLWIPLLVLLDPGVPRR